MRLFKYVCSERLEEILNNQKIRFTQFSELNDPYECEIFNDSIRINSDDLMNDNRLRAIEKEAILQGNKLKIEEKQLEIKNEVNNRFLILSLSKNEKNPLMWAHYAENHKGAVIELDISHKIFSETDIIMPPSAGEVKYNNIKPNIGSLFGELKYEKTDSGYSLKSSGIEHNTEIFLNKSSDWSYEEEVRVIRDKLNSTNCKSTNNIHLYPLPYSSIKSIIFGARFTNENIEKIIPSHINLNKVRIINTNYQLELISVRQAYSQ